MEHYTLFIILACAFGFFMAWGIGANDVANAMGTSVGSRALTIKQAIIVAAIFEAAGALLAGGEVTDTIRGKIIDSSVLEGSPEILVYGMLAALLAAGSWLLIATAMGLPVSTTHSIVGAIIGFGLVHVGIHAIYWSKVVSIVLSWVLTPCIAGIVAFIIFRSVQKFILTAADPLLNAKRYVPIYIFLVAFVISMVTLTKGLQHLGFNLHFTASITYAILFGLLCSALGMFTFRKINADSSTSSQQRFLLVERVFGILMIFTACSMAFAHGSNDVANAIGPVAAIINILQDGAHIAQKSAITTWVLVLGAVGIVAGLSMFGYRVIATIGHQITELTPSRGFAAELATASTVVIASGTGLPISTTQTLVGAVLGVGLARGLAALKLNVVRNIFMSWVVTLPVGALLAIVFFYVLQLLI
ncbi:MAG: phosphate permease [Legionellales bacterium]|nr:phosphate permease [Legionellales bacterium]